MNSDSLPEDHNLEDMMSDAVGEIFPRNQELWYQVEYVDGLDREVVESGYMPSKDEIDQLLEKFRDPDENGYKYKSDYLWLNGFNTTPQGPSVVYSILDDEKPGQLNGKYLLKVLRNVPSELDVFDRNMLEEDHK